MRDEPRIGYTGLGIQSDVVQLKIRDADKYDEAGKRLRNLLNPLSTGALGGAAVSEFQLDQGSDGLMRLGFSQTGLDKRLGTVVQQSIEVIRRRVDQMGAVEPSIQRQGSDRILVEAPGEKDPARLKSIIGRTAQMTFHLVDLNVSPEEAAKGNLPPGEILLKQKEAGGIPMVVDETPLMSGEDLTDAQTSFQSQTNEPVVSFRLSTSGARKFAQVTTESVGRLFAIVLDDEIISAPRINEPITRVPARFPATSPSKAPTTSPCCCEPVRCRPSCQSLRSVPSVRDLAPTRSPLANGPP